MSKSATIQNMRTHYEPGVFAFSRVTGEEYSANPADYFWLPAGHVLLDSKGYGCVLVTRTCTVVGVR